MNHLSKARLFLSVIALLIAFAVTGSASAEQVGPVVEAKPVFTEYDTGFGYDGLGRCAGHEQFESERAGADCRTAPEPVVGATITNK